jgi:proteasome lid subunit RPN8/RPN11
LKKHRSPDNESATRGKSPADSNPSAAKGGGMAGKFESTPDVRLLGAQEFTGAGENARFPGAGAQDFRIYFAPEAHRAIHQHARETTSVEVGGVLVGHWGRDDDGPYVAVTDIIRCDAATSKSGEVTFTHEAWNVVNREMDTRFADLKIVGWYHTHPGFGVFLSERDRFIQEHFFGSPGQIAYVVDPLAETEGVFAWRGGKPALWPHFWIGDQICAAAAAEAETKNAPGRSPASAPQAAATPQERETFLSLASRAIMYLLVFLIGYLLADMRSGWERRMLVNGVVAHYGLWKAIRPGLGENLELAQSGLDSAAAAMKSLAADAEKAEGKEAEEKKKQWRELQMIVQNTRLLLGRIEDVYALSPEEEAVMAKAIADKLAELETAKKPASGGAKPVAKPAEKSKPAADKPASPQTKNTETKPAEK